MQEKLTAGEIAQCVIEDFMKGPCDPEDAIGISIKCTIAQFLKYVHDGVHREHPSGHLSIKDISEIQIEALENCAFDMGDFVKKMQLKHAQQCTTQ